MCNAAVNFFFCVLYRNNFTPWMKPNEIANTGVMNVITANIKFDVIIVNNWNISTKTVMLGNVNFFQIQLR